MSVRALYFKLLHRICDAGAQVDDSASSNTFTRLGRLASLMDLRSESQGDPSVDRRSGYPILKEVISVRNDIMGNTGAMMDPAVVQTKLLDSMLIQRRLPADELIRDMSTALYHSAVQKAEGVMGPEPVDLDPVNFKNERLGLSWDYWDGPGSQPIRLFGWFVQRTSEKVPEGILKECGRKFSGAGMKPVTLAAEIDKSIQHLRLKILKKVTLTKFCSPIFTELDDEHQSLLGSLADEDAWITYWTIDTVESTGTRTSRKFLIGPKVYYEKFKLDSSDKLLSERGASESENHALMPHAVYQRIQGDPVFSELKRQLRDTKIHILTQGSVSSLGHTV
jgi:hypothetical protein